MNLAQYRTLETGRRVQSFLDAQSALIGKRVAKVRQQLDEAVSQLTAYQIEQSQTGDTARSETAIQMTMRRDLHRRYLRPIKRIAQRKLRSAPEYQSLIVPSPKSRYDDFDTQAIAAVKSIALYEQVFVENGMAVDFLTALKESIGRLGGSTKNRATHQTRCSAATAGIKAMQKAIIETVVVLDGVLTPVFESDQALLAGWTAAKRIHHTAVTPREAGDPVPAAEKPAA